METINPNDITEVDKNSISLITLKNGNMIMIDDSVPEKPKTEKKQINDEQPKSEKKPQPLSISQHLTCSFEGKEQPINKNLEKINEKYQKFQKIQILLILEYQEKKLLIIIFQILNIIIIKIPK